MDLCWKVRLDMVTNASKPPVKAETKKETKKSNKKDNKEEKDNG